MTFGIPRNVTSRSFRMRIGLAGWGCRQRTEFLLEQALRRGEIEHRTGDAIEMADVHLEVERIDVAQRPAFRIVLAQLAIDVFIGVAHGVDDGVPCGDFRAMRDGATDQRARFAFDDRDQGAFMKRVC